MTTCSLPTPRPARAWPWTAFASFLLASALGLPAQAQTTETTVVEAVRFNTSAPLRSNTAAPGMTRDFPYIVPNRFEKFNEKLFGEDRFFVPQPPGFVDPVLDLGVTAQARGGFLPGSGEVLLSHEGASSLDNQTVLGGTAAPPDPTGDVGPNHYVQMINTVTRIFDRSGNTLLGPISNNAFFQGLGGLCEVTNNGDPIVLYDELADRWLVTQFALTPTTTTPSSLCLAVSATPDPTGAYHQYEFGFTDFADYPKFGVWPDAYYGTVNEFTAAGAYQRSSALAFERDAMLVGAPARMTATAVTGFSSPLPADVDGTPPAAGEPGLIMVVCRSCNDIRIFEYDVDWGETAAATLTEVAVLPAAPFSLLPGTSVPQPGTAQLLDNLGTRPMFRLQYRNWDTYQTLLFDYTVDAGGGRAGKRWYELRKNAGAWGIHQQGTYAPDDGLHRWMGSISMNGAGDIAMAYSVSSKTTFPSLRFTGQSAAQSGTGLMDMAETEIHAGTGSQTNPTRWGDYSHLTVDPTDDATFWYTNEYYATTSAFNYKTRIARLRAFATTPPVASVSQGGVSLTLDPGSSATRSVTVSNTAAPGSGDLLVSASLTNFAPLPPAAGLTAPAPVPETAPAGQSVPVEGVPLADGAADLGGETVRPAQARANLPTCTEGQVFAQNSRTNFTEVVAGGQEIGQSFTAPCDGKLKVVSPALFSGGAAGTVTGILRVYAGSGTAGTQIASEPVSYTNPSPSEGLLNVTLSTPVNIVSGQSYTWFLDLTAGSSRQLFSTANPYAGGVLYVTTDGNPASAFASSANDVQFQLTFGAGVPPFVSVAPTSATVAAGSSAALTLTFNATDKTEGTYTADLVISTNDLDNPSTTIPVTLTVSGSNVVAGAPGWRLLAPAASGMTVDDLAALNLVQGVPGYFPPPEAGPNLLTGYTGTAFTTTGTGAPLVPGTGFFWYFYDIDFVTGGPSNSTKLPTVLTTTRAAVTTDTPVALHADGDKANMLGNPFGVSLNISETSVASWPGSDNLLSNVLQVYNANGPGYDSNLIVTRVAAWQGFFAEAATAGTLTIPASARTSGGTLQRGAAAEALVAFELATEDGTLTDRGAVLTLGEGRAAGPDRGDAAKLAPPASAYVLAAFATGDDGALRAVESRPLEAATVPMSVASVGGGQALTLTWPRVEGLPQGWALTLRDTETGTTVDLGETASYAFSVAPVAARQADAAPASARAAAVAPRFELSYGPRRATAGEGSAEAEFALGLSRPNPVRGTSLVDYSLAETGSMRLAVIDLLGREVAILASGEQTSGRHTVALNGSSLAPGVYVMRLSAGREALTRRVVVVR